MLRVSELEPMSNEEEIWSFILTPFKDRFMLFTGGHQKNDRIPIAATHLLDIITGRWLKSPGQPDMNDARSYHSSSTTRDQAFVFFGWSSRYFQQIESIERTDISFEAYTPDTPILSPWVKIVPDTEI